MIVVSVYIQGISHNVIISCMSGVCPKKYQKELRRGFFKKLMELSDHTQLIFTCSKSIIETLKKGIKYVQS